MPTHADFVAHCGDLLAGAGAVRSRRMFGGWGLYVDGLFVGIVTGDVLYLKADDESRARFEAAGGRPFEYVASGQQRRALGFWTVPAEAMDSPAFMLPWARMALRAAERAAARPAKKNPSRPRRS